MLSEFLEEWNAAVQTRIPVSVTKTDGKIMAERATFQFRGHEIEMVSKLGRDGKYYAELYVPFTNKFIPNKKFATATDCAIEIILALKEGTEYEDRRLLRTKQKAENSIKKINSKRKELLDKLFPNEYVTYLLGEFEKNIVNRNVRWDDSFITTLEKYGREITAGDILESVVRIEYLHALYAVVATTLDSDMSTDRYGNAVVRNDFVERYIYKDQTNWQRQAVNRPYVRPLIHARTTLGLIYEATGRGPRFLHALKHLVQYYQHVTGVPVEIKLAELKSKKMELQKAKMTPRSKGGANLKHQCCEFAMPIAELCPELDKFEPGKNIGPIINVPPQKPAVEKIQLIKTEPEQADAPEVVPALEEPNVEKPIPVKKKSVPAKKKSVTKKKVTKKTKPKVINSLAELDTLGGEDE